MKILYISDLDKTLLSSHQELSEYTISCIQEFHKQGIYFSFATARSLITTKKVTSGIDVTLPVVVYNGTFVMDYQSGEILVSNYFEDHIKDVIIDLINHHICPIVYSFKEGKERLSFLPDNQSQGIKDYLNDRINDPRLNPVDAMEELLSGDIFYITCIDDTKKLQALYEKYRYHYRTLYQKDVYRDNQWFEIMPKNASKAHASLQLKDYLGCDYMIAFGDHYNDMELFKVADEAYAVNNAIDELKAIATGIIKSNDEDGVVDWIKKHIYKSMD